MTSPAKFPFVQRDPAVGNASLSPLLPVTLHGPQSLDEMGLLDTGATVNVLPYQAGLQLGFDWDAQTTRVQLTGNLAAVEARVVVVPVSVGPFPQTRLAFAWAKMDSVPVLLGQINFFLEFEVCFFRARAVFEVRPKQ